MGPAAGTIEATPAKSDLELGVETSAHITAEHDPAARRRRR
ncbi:hypothetical protein ABZ470_20910 [Streptosporangium sp. NPDC020072]